MLLRGLLDAALIIPYLQDNYGERRGVALLVGGIMLGGGLLELLMFYWMRKHPFQGILRLTGFAGVLIGIFLLLIEPVTVQLILVASGLWLAVRGFAALWLGLSIVERPLDRAIPVAAGLGSALIGVAAMVALPPDLGLILAIIAAYGAGSAFLHTVVALRMRLIGPLSPESG